MKRIVCILILVCIVMGAAFAQAKPATPAPSNPPPATPAKPANPPPATPAKPANPAPATPATGAATAPATGAKANAFALDVFQLFNGFISSNDDKDTSFFAISVAYERLVAPHFSIGADLDLIFGEMQTRDGIYFGISAEGRYYPMSENFEKLFIGTTLGYNSCEYKVAGVKFDLFSGLFASLKLGYKVMLKNVYLEPSISYCVSKATGMFGGGSTTGESLLPIGWRGGLRFGFVF